jgi:hypothetical protein
MAASRWLSMVSAGMAVWVLPAALLVFGCDRDAEQKRVTTTTLRTPTTGPSGVQLASAAPASRPTFSMLTVTGIDPSGAAQEFKFPPARLVVVGEEPTIELLLVSDDPPKALAPGYKDHRYYLTLRLPDINDLAQIRNADMMEKAQSMERADSPDGIFLNGDQIVLQPYEWTVGFSGNGPDALSLAVQGKFILFNNAERVPAAEPKLVLVQGTLFAELEQSGKARKNEPAAK